MSERTCILVPVLGRPANVAPLLESIEATTPQPHRVLFIADEGDDAELAELEQQRRRWEHVAYIWAPAGARYAQKINRGYSYSSEPLLFQAADDLRFHPHWLEAARRELEHEGAEVVGTNDLTNQRTMLGQHSTHTLFTRSYIEAEGGTWDEGPGVVMHEGYAHEFCDDELVETARARGRYRHAFGAIVEHLHPLAGKAEDDATYQRGREGTRQSRQLFRRRRRQLWAPR